MSEEELTEEDVIKYLEECNESQDILGFCYIPEMVCSKILDLYNKEKEKNKKYENKIKAVLELIDTKPYTAYTLYGDILYDDENIRELLEERN